MFSLKELRLRKEKLGKEMMRRSEQCTGVAHDLAMGTISMDEFREKYPGASSVSSLAVGISYIKREINRRTRGI